MQVLCFGTIGEGHQKIGEATDVVYIPMRPFRGVPEIRYLSFVFLVASPKGVLSSCDPALQVTSVNLQVKYLDVCTRSRPGYIPGA